MSEMNYKAKWSCPSNIALIKYWGKKPGQLPLNPSLSFGLQKSRTVTTVSIEKSPKAKVRFLFEGKESPFGERVVKFVELLKFDHPWIQDYSFLIESENSFPHSAGIASSASSFGALALCLTELAFRIKGISAEGASFYEAASRMARIGSGSGCRSVYKGFVLWGKTQLIKGSTDCNAIPLPSAFHPDFETIHDAVLLVDSSKKKVSSSVGHELMNKHLFKPGRIAQANQNLTSLMQAMRKGDHQQFLQIAENEALTLHGLMMSSNPSYLLLRPESLAILEKINHFREQTHIPVGFTIDAGPNIHLLYFDENRAQVRDFIQTELIGLLENGLWMDDRIGEGPERLE